MERLQTAIEKARARRQAAPERAANPKADTSAIGLDAAWGGFAALETNAGKLRKNRLVAFESGPDAGPYDMLRTRILQQAQKKRMAPLGGCLAACRLWQDHDRCQSYLQFQPAKRCALHGF